MFYEDFQFLIVCEFYSPDCFHYYSFRVVDSFGGFSLFYLVVASSVVYLAVLLESRCIPSKTKLRETKTETIITTTIKITRAKFTLDECALAP